MKKLCLVLLCLLAPAFAGAESALNVSYVKSPFNLQSIVMKNRGILEDELKPLGMHPVWHEINSGAQQAQALAAGSLDVALVINTTSAQLACSEGNPIKIFAANAKPADIFGIAGAKDGPNNITELKGKIVAGPKGTVLHQLLAAALQKNGMTLADIQLAQMDIPKGFAALESGHADAALLAGNALIKAEEAGHRILTTASGLVTPKLAMASSENFIKEHPEIIRAVVSAHDKAAQWIKDHHEEAIALGAKEQNISVEEAENLFQRSHFTQRFTPDDIRSMDDDMQFMLDNGMMRHKIDNNELVLPEALK